MAVAKKPDYQPIPYAGPIDANSAPIVEWMHRELRNIASTFQQSTTQSLQPLAVAPAKPRTGMMAQADGTNWNPGGGAGLYTYNGTSWVGPLNNGVGDGPTGFALIGTGTSSAPTFQGFTSTLTGGATRTWPSKVADFVDALDICGNNTIDPTGAVDSTAGIAAAISNAPSGCQLRFPPGNFKVSGTGTSLPAPYTGSALFFITKDIVIVGEGWDSIGGGTQFTPAAGVGTTVDIFCWEAQAHPGLFNNGLKDLSIVPASTSACRDLVKFVSPNNPSGVNYIKIENVFLGPSGGHSINFDNNTGLSGGGGTANVLVRGCVTDSIVMSNAGDSFRFVDNEISSATRTALTISQIVTPASAGNVWVSGNNILSSANSAINIAQGLNITIIGNEITTSNSGVAPVIWLTGIAATINVTILGNELGDNGSGAPDIINLTNSANIDHTYIESNWIGTDSARNAIFINPGPTKTVIGAGNKFSNAVAGTGGCQAGVSNNAGTQTVDMRNLTTLYLGTYNSTNLPAAGSFLGAVITLTDYSGAAAWNTTYSSGGATTGLFMSNGTNWKLFAL